MLRLCRWLHTRPTSRRLVKRHQLPPGFDFGRASTPQNVQRILPVCSDAALVRGKAHALSGVQAAYRVRQQPFPLQHLLDGKEARVPSDSWLSMTFPFGSQPEIRDLYALFGSDTQLRVGYVLENLDALAADIAYRHTGLYREANTSIVTAALDRFSFEPLRADRDLVLAGNVSWAGRSSMEVRIDVTSKTEEEREHHGTAVFVMVARDGDTGEAVQVPELIPTTVEERQHAEKAERRKVERKNWREFSLEKHPPLSDEAAFLHEVYKNHVLQKTSDSRAVQMSKFSFLNAEIMHSQDRNIHNKIFGGHLMRLALELAHTTTRAYAAPVHPTLLGVEEVHFLKPVPLGCVLSFKSQLQYVDVETRQAIVHVETRMMDDATGGFVADRANELYFLLSMEGGEEELRPLVPTTYAEAMTLLHGRRRWLHWQGV